MKSKSKNASQPRVHLTFTKKQFDLLNEFVIEGEYGDKMATALQALIMETLRRRKETDLHYNLQILCRILTFCARETLWAKPVSGIGSLVIVMKPVNLRSADHD